MAVSALELRPRGAVDLMDAAVRLCSRNSGVWALTLPGGAAVVAALLHLVDAVKRGLPLALPALGLTLAWFLRGLCQGAATHYVQELLLGKQTEVALGPSLRAALDRAPSLFIAVAYLALFQVITVPLTLGISLIVMSAQSVGYAVTMHGRGNPLRLYSLCTQLLGPARGTAVGVRLLMTVQLFALLNLHIGANFLLLLGRQLLGVDLTFAERFASLDNTSWLLFLAAITFALFEPVRATTATLLLVDGRVRQEGLDLLAAVQQLPPRSAARSHSGVAALVLVLVGALFVGTPANAETAPSVRERLEAVARACEAPEVAQDARLGTVDALQATERGALERLASRVEQLAQDDEDCDTALSVMEQGLEQALATAKLTPHTDSRNAAERARDILARPEFQVAPADEPKLDDPAQPPPPGWLNRFIDWLNEFFKRQKPPPAPDIPMSPWVSGDTMANGLVVVLVGATLCVLAWVLIRTLRSRTPQDAEGALDVTANATDSQAANTQNALSRPPESWAHLADELAARGEYREAVRSLYLALLSRLHRDGAILYDVTLSNWDYLRTFRGRAEWKPSFRELTYRFDFAWYGNTAVGAEGYREFRALTSPFLAPAPEVSGA
ncbi:DUF4129 domain-containing protein [Corallococcus sp. M34]|uniref:DUF4129 domain-containing protein n=1 Tax=Citreicoccus inhibens TaxID=2849499 RepID=UPI001C212261|nr:DUF4129 domain-containing protein [Citreicoccus inhibens]MBU8894969.1 DUF4129 domain-containing protein [Citreicoccus inhibens]